MVDLTVNFDTLHQLYRAYMPFIQPAGLFVATTEGHFLGQEIQIGYRLPGSTHVNEFQGRGVDQPARCFRRTPGRYRG